MMLKSSLLWLGLKAGRHAVTLVSARSFSSASGLFGLPGLQQPSDFSVLLQQTLSRCQQLVSDICLSPPNLEVVRLMDDLSNEICKTYDAAECCRNIHSDPAWRASADAVCQKLGEYISEVNQHEGMYSKLQASLMLNRQHSSLTASTSSSTTSNSSSVQQKGGWRAGEDVLVGQRLLQDFEAGGVGLSDPQQRQRVQHLAQLNHHYPVAFHRNLVNSKVGSTRVQIPGSFRSQVVSLDPSSLQTFLLSTSDEAARRQVWECAHQGPQSNIKLLDDMVRTRGEMAALLGAPSYSHLKAEGGTLAQRPEAVMEFLNSLSDAARPFAEQDVQVFAEAKAKALGKSRKEIRVGAWDQDHFMAKAKSVAAASLPKSISEYLVLEGVLSGLQQLTSRMLGVRLDVGRVPPEEGWAPALLKLTAHSEESGVLGTLYLDLARRHGKPAGSMLFPIRCGKELGVGEYQQPVLVLCSDFGPAVAGGVERMAVGWRDVRVLMHEMGHALHNLISRTKFQHLWGTRCAVDLMEVPSHVMEGMCDDPRTAAILARKRGGGEGLPVEAHRQLMRMQHMFSGLELQTQTMLALVDQHYFGPHSPAPGEASSTWHSLATSHSSLEHPPKASPQARFSHLALYGATYYSYLYARCLAAAVWETHLKHDPLDPDAGARVRQLLLEPGGGKEPLTLVKDLLGEGQLLELGGGWAPSPDAYLERLKGLLKL